MRVTFATVLRLTFLSYFFFFFGLGQQLTEEFSHLTGWPASPDAKQGVPASIVVCLRVYVFEQITVKASHLLDR